MNKAPAFQFYPKDWMDFKVQRMSYEAQGIYMKLLCFMWSDSKDQCSILNDDHIIAKSLGMSLKKWLKIKEEIFYKNDPIFLLNGSKIISPRLRKEIRKIRTYKRKQAEKGRKSGVARRKKKRTTVEPRLNRTRTGSEPNTNSSSSSSSSSSNKKKEENIKSENSKFNMAFEELWKSWPSADRGGKKKHCRMRFVALCKAGKLEEFKKTTQGYSDFLKHKKEVENFPQRAVNVSTWLNNWEEDQELYRGFKYEPRL